MIDRRRTLTGITALSIPSTADAAPESVRVALLHLAPQPGALEINRRAIESATLRAAEHGARVIVTPELALSGYGFRDRIGTAWIAAQQAETIAWAGALSRRAAAFVLLGMPEAVPSGDALFNSLLVFAPDGSLAGRHRKIAVLRVGSESWSSPGDRATVVALDGIGRVGLAICADMYSERLVRETVAQGVDVLVSAAAWASGHHGPAGEWERASRMAQRPVLVCNRTGVDVLDFTGARSVAAVGGSIAQAHASPAPAVVLADWSPSAGTVTEWWTLALPSP